MIYQFLADGFEEMEAIVPYDYLRRAGVEIALVGVTGKVVTGSHSVPMTCELTVQEMDLDHLEGILLPGGMPGTNNLYASEDVRRVITLAVEQKLLIGAICAAPSILGRMGILRRKHATCFPGFENFLLDAIVTQRPVTVDGNLITAKGAGVSLEYAYELTKYLKGQKKAQEIAEQIQWKQA